MNFSRSSKPDIYSTVVIHGDDDGGSDENSPRDPQPEPGTDEDDDSSLPPLLQRLPKDFGVDIDSDESDDGDYAGTFIVKKDKKRTPTSTRRTLRSPFQDLRRSSPRSRSDVDDVYSTFVVKSTVSSSSRGDDEEEVSASGRMSVSGGFGSSIMSEAVESMKASMDEGRQRQEQIRRRASVSSVPESITREDPSTKYELLHELGKCYIFNVLLPILNFGTDSVQDCIKKTKRDEIEN